MRKKVRKFASGGDILTGVGAVLIGKHLYDKYKEGKGKDDEDSDYARKAKEFRESKKEAEATAVESKAEPKEEPKTVSAGEKRAMAASKGRPELIPEDADEATMRSDNYPSRKPVVTTTPKKAAPAAKKAAPAASESSNTTPLTYYTPPDNSPKPAMSKPKSGPSGKAAAQKNVFKVDKSPNRSYNKGGAVKKYASGGSVSSASKRADGIAQRGKTRGRVL